MPSAANRTCLMLDETKLSHHKTLQFISSLRRMCTPSPGYQRNQSYASKQSCGIASELSHQCMMACDVRYRQPGNEPDKDLFSKM